MRNSPSHSNNNSHRRWGVLGGEAPRSMKKADPRILSDPRKRAHPTLARVESRQVLFPHGAIPSVAPQLPSTLDRHPRPIYRYIRID